MTEDDEEPCSGEAKASHDQSSNESKPDLAMIAPLLPGPCVTEPHHNVPELEAAPPGDLPTSSADLKRATGEAKASLDLAASASGHGAATARPPGADALVEEIKRRIHSALDEKPIQTLVGILGLAPDYFSYPMDYDYFVAFATGFGSEGFEWHDDYTHLCEMWGCDPRIGLPKTILLWCIDQDADDHEPTPPASFFEAALRRAFFRSPEWFEGAAAEFLRDVARAVSRKEAVRSGEAKASQETAHRDKATGGEAKASPKFDSENGEAKASRKHKKKKRH